jgi:hypothetical protein
LSEKAYTPDTVQGLFTSAFTVANELVTSAKQLGIRPDAVQMLLEPAPDRYFEITTVGKALLANIAVAAGRYPFSVYSTGLKALPREGIVNLCYNNQILKASGDTVEFKSFLENLGDEPRMVARSIKSRYFGTTPQPVQASVVPVETAGEAEGQSCIALVGTSNGQGLIPKGRPIYSCLGFTDGGTELADRIAKKGIDDFRFSAGEGCLTQSKLALLPWDTPLQDIPFDFQED